MPVLRSVSTRSAKAAAPEADMALPVEAGKTQVEVTLSGSVQMR